MSKKKTAFLKLISGNKPPIIAAADGMETLVKIIDFPTSINGDFVVKYGADEQGQATKKTPVDVYEMSPASTFENTLGLLSKDIGKICLTQAQIKNFLKEEKHRKWLRNNCGTFFPFRSRNNFFVARVSFVANYCIDIDIRQLIGARVWRTEDTPWFVVPRLI